MRRVGPLTQGIALTMVMTLVLALTAYKAEQNAMRRARFHERDVKLKATCELGEEVTKRVETALMAGVTFRDFSEEFGSPVALDQARNPKYAEMTHSLFHEKSQQTFYLQFADGKLVGSRSNYGYADIDTGVVLETPAYLRGESVRVSVLGIGELAWLVALIAAIRMRRPRRRIVVILVVVSLVCGLCWFLAPNYSPTLRGISSNDNLGIGALLLLASLGLVAVTARRDGDPDGKTGLHNFAAH